MVFLWFSYGFPIIQYKKTVSQWGNMHTFYKYSLDAYLMASWRGSPRIRKKLVARFAGHGYIGFIGDL